MLLAGHKWATESWPCSSCMGPCDGMSFWLPKSLGTGLSIFWRSLDREVLKSKEDWVWVEEAVIENCDGDTFGPLKQKKSVRKLLSAIKENWGLQNS